MIIKRFGALIFSVIIVLWAGRVNVTHADDSMVSRIILSVAGDTSLFNFYLSPDGASHNYQSIEKDSYDNLLLSRDLVMSTGIYAPEQIKFQSPDATTQLVITPGKQTTGQTTLSLTVTDGSKKVFTGSLTGDAFAIPPSWSPDGKKILLTEFLNNSGVAGMEKSQFDVLDLDGSNRIEQITPDKPIRMKVEILIEAYFLLGQAPAFWTLDGKHIIATGILNTSDNPIQLIIMDTNGKNVGSFLKDTSKTVSGASWSPDGKHLLFQYADGLTSSGVIATSDSNGSDLQSLTPSTKYYYSPVWSPDGSQIAFAKAGTDRAIGVWVMDADGKNQHKIFDLVQQGKYIPVGVPLGTTITYSLTWTLIYSKVLDGLPTSVPTSTP